MGPRFTALLCASALGAALCLPLSAATAVQNGDVAPVPAASGERQIAAVADVNRWFADIGYRLDSVRDGGAQVPRIVLANFPDDMGTLDSPELRKQFFIQAILPIILQANEAILQQRAFLQALREAPAETWTDDDRAQLNWLAAEYATDPNDLGELVRRVDVVPPSLALAQAAEESGWGTSRFAKQGNAVFGQWTFDDQIGLVPAGRDEGKQHLVRSYGALYDSVLGYLRNLNTHDAYTAFRNRREYLRDHLGDLDANQLAATLIYYSERRTEYVKTIRGIITANGLAALDTARLEDIGDFTAE